MGQNKYESLTRLTVSHSFFSDQLFTGFSFKPDKQTDHHFNRLSLFFRPLSDGFGIYYMEDEFEKRNRNKILSEPLHFYFEITNLNTDFINYTNDLPDDVSLKYLFFQNHIYPDPSQQNGSMHKNTFFSVVDTLQNQRADPENAADQNREFFKKPFGIIQIVLHPNLEDQLFIKFKAKETFWRYIINSDYLQQLVDPAIIDKDTKEVFLAQQVELPDGSKRLAFQSQQSMALSNKPKKSFQLVENFQKETGLFKKLVIKSLPNPNVRHISLVKSENDLTPEKNISEIFI